MAIIQTSKIIINTIVRVLPLGLYLATLLSSMLLDNKQGLILFFGHAINDLIGLAYRFILKPSGKAQCAIVRVADVYYTLPAPYIQIVAYYFSFFVADMYYKGEFDNVKFIGLLVILMITIWSRIDVGCKNLLEVILSFSIGCGIGITYYLIIKEYYNWDNNTLINIATARDDSAINNVFKYFN
jgi:hypothetical protein